MTILPSPGLARFYWKVWDMRCVAGSKAKHSSPRQICTVGVLLLDMRMPVMDGHAVHEAMRQRESTLAVVFLTGHGDVPMAVEQMKRGAVDFCKSRFPPRLCKRR